MDPLQHQEPLARWEKNSLKVIGFCGVLAVAAAFAIPNLNSKEGLDTFHKNMPIIIGALVIGNIIFVVVFIKAILAGDPLLERDRRP